MEAGSGSNLFALLGEADALVGDFLFELLDARDVLIDDRLIDQRPEGFGRLQLRAVGRSRRGATPSNAWWGGRRRG